VIEKPHKAVMIHVEKEKRNNGKIKLTPIGGVYSRYREVLVSADDGRGWGRDKVVMRIVRRKRLMGWKRMLGRNVRLTGNRMLRKDRLILNAIPRGVGHYRRYGRVR
jgi:hypothetical protein